MTCFGGAAFNDELIRIKVSLVEQVSIIKGVVKQNVIDTFTIREIRYI